MSNKRSSRPVLVASSLNADVSIFVHSAPGPGETVMGSSVMRSLGGKGANTAVAAARALASDGVVHLVAACGNDAVGKSLTDEIAEAGVDTEFVRHVSDTSTGTAHIVVEANGENRIIVTAGANARFGETLFKEELWNALANAVVVLHLEIPPPDVLEIAQQAHNQDALVILNPSPVAGLCHIEEVLKYVDFVVLNEVEVAQISGIARDPSRGAQELFSRCRADACIVVTRGKDDVIIMDKNTTSFMNAVNARRVVDTTGAGDTLTGYLAAGIACGLNAREALKVSVTAASMSVESKGASTSIPESAEVVKRLQELSV